MSKHPRSPSHLIPAVKQYEADSDGAKLRMSVYEEHKLDCLGSCDPLDWHTFKRVWAKHDGFWADAFLEAGELAAERGTD